MTIAAVSSSLVNQQSPGYFHERRVDLQQLSKDLQSGDLAAAQQDFNTIQTLAQGGPFANGDTFKVSQRQQDFAAIGQALQSGDIAGAQQAFSQLQATFGHRHHIAPPPPTAASAPAPASSPAASGAEIVLNLGNVPAGEQITIGLGPSANGGEQVTVGLSNPQNQSPEQITLNLAANSNQQIVLNLFNATAPTAASGNNVSVTA